MIGGAGHGAWALQAASEGAQGKIIDRKVVTRIWGYLRPHKLRVLWALLLVAITATMQLVGPYLLKVAIDEFIVARQDLGGLVAISAIYAVTLVISYFTDSNQSYTMALATQDVLNRIRGDLFEKLNKLSLSYHDTHETGVTMSRIVNDVAVFQELLTQGVINVVADTLKLVGIIAIMFYMSPKLAGVTMIVLPIMVVATILFTQRARKAFVRTRETIGQVAAGFQENVSGVRVVQAFAREEVSKDRFDEINQGNRRANLFAMALSSAYPPVVEFMGMAATAIVLWFGTRACSPAKLPWAS